MHQHLFRSKAPATTRIVLGSGMGPDVEWENYGKLWKVMFVEGFDGWDFNGLEYVEFERIQHYWQLNGGRPKKIANLLNLTMFWGY